MCNGVVCFKMEGELRAREENEWDGQRMERRGARYGRVGGNEDESSRC